MSTANHINKLNHVAYELNSLKCVVASTLRPFIDHDDRNCLTGISKSLRIQDSEFHPHCSHSHEQTRSAVT